MTIFVFYFVDSVYQEKKHNLTNILTHCPNAGYIFYEVNWLLKENDLR